MTESINQRLREHYLKGNLLDIIYKLDELSKEQKELILSLFICDDYKMRFYKAASNFDMCEIGELQSQTIDDLLYKCEDDAKFLYEVISHSREFHSLCNLSKISLMEMLNTWGQNKKLVELSKLHLYDALAYNFNFDLDCLSAYYYDYKKGRKLDDEDFQSIIIYRLNNLANDDKNKYSRIILEYAKEFYKWTNFAYKHFGAETLYALDVEYLKVIETKDLDYIVDLTRKDFDFLLTLVDSYVFYMENSSGEDISKNIVDNYYNNETPDAIKNKFKKRTN